MSRLWLGAALLTLGCSDKAINEVELTLTQPWGQAQRTMRTA
jgi:hypothetical protein